MRWVLRTLMTHRIYGHMFSADAGIVLVREEYSCMLWACSQPYCVNDSRQNC